jgi:Ca2+-binding EF-hand superfamily protein
MKLTFIRVIAASLVTLPMAAMAADYMAADNNQDGMLSLEEVQTILPEMTTDTFMEVDADGDGLINADELTVAQTEGLMPEADSTDG